MGAGGGKGMIPMTPEMCPLIFKFETGPLSRFILQPRQIALGGHSDGEQRNCLAALSNTCCFLFFSMELWR